MKAVLLGSGGYFPNRHRHTASVLLPELGIVFDAGTGLFRLPQWKQTERLDFFLSHAHLDHVVGLTYLLGLLPGYPKQRLHVHSTPETWSAIRQHLFDSQLFPVAPPFEHVPLTPIVQLDCGPRITSFPLRHPGGSTGFRLDWNGRSLAYVTDTTADPDAPYAEQLAGVGLLIHECNFGDQQKELADRTGHSTASQVARLAARCRAERLVLVHLNPTVDDPEPLAVEPLRRIFPQVELGRDELQLTW